MDFRSDFRTCKIRPLIFGPWPEPNVDHQTDRVYMHISAYEEWALRDVSRLLVRISRAPAIVPPVISVDSSDSGSSDSGSVGPRESWLSRLFPRTAHDEDDEDDAPTASAAAAEAGEAEAGKALWATLGEPYRDAEADVIYVPNWMMEELEAEGIGVDSTVRVRLHTGAPPPTATHLVLRAHCARFLEVEDPRETLEAAIQGNYGVMQAGTAVQLLTLGDGEFTFDVVRCEPEGVVSMADAEVSVEFERPRDYRSPVHAAVPGSVLANDADGAVAVADDLFGIPPSTISTGFVAFTGEGQRLASIEPSSALPPPPPAYRLGRQPPPPRRIPGLF
jgi:hypothetical protein